MKTLLFATGETKKLVPLTDQVVSPLLPVLNRPVMDYILEVLGKQKVSQIDVSLHNRPDEIEAFFGDGRHRGLKLTYHLQREAWGDGGAVRWAFSAPDEPVLLVPADILIDLNLDTFRAFHETHGGDITVLVIPAPEGALPQPRLTIRDGRITELSAQPPEGKEQRYLPTGVYLISPEVIRQIPSRKHCDILQDLIPALLQAGRPVAACEYSGFWNSLDSFTKYQEAQLSLCQGGQPDGVEHPASASGLKSGLQFLTMQGRLLSQGIWIGRNNAIHPSVQMAPTVFVHDNCRLEKNVQIGPNVVIGQNVVVDSEATLSNAIILDHTYVGRMLNVQSKIVYKNLVIDIFTGEHIIIKDQFLLAETEDEHVDIEIRRFLSSVFAFTLFILLLPLFIPIGIFLGITGSSILSFQECMHTDFRWFVPVSERHLRTFKLLQLQLQRKDGSYVPLGRLLEVSQLYRYPTLINVIKGDIAFIGVNPLPAKIVKQLSEEWQRTRFLVPAGLTGLWYLQTDEKASLDQILIADAYYAATRNIKMDLSILSQLPKAWLKQIL